MEVLIAGAGVAGLSLAALLGRQGHDVTVVDRRSEEDGQGYGLALWPHGTRVLHAVGVHRELVARSLPTTRYTARDARGRVLVSAPMPGPVTDQGAVGVLPRGELVGLLRDACAGVDVRFGSGVAAVEQGTDRVRVTLDDGSRRTADVLVGADGIGSAVRLALHGPLERHDTGWACVVAWTGGGAGEPGETTEWWSAGGFLGSYPCRDRVCVIAGAPAARLREPDERAHVLRRLAAPAGAEVADALVTAPPSWWPMADVRAPGWVAGRVALVGDAATGFLPTAGIGASMALESAAALADELSRTDADHAPQALRLYERRRRRRVERAQTQSRRLARLMFVRSRALAALRDRAVARASMDLMVGPLVRDLQRPI